MKAKDLKKDQQFKVAEVGWEDTPVLEVLVPFNSDVQHIYGCHKEGKKMGMTGFSVLAGHGDEVGGLRYYTYALPIMTEVKLLQ